MPKYLAVMLGAALGGAARYAVAAMITARMVSRFPWGTFAVNITGCFLIGLISTILIERVPAGLAWSLFLVTEIGRAHV